MEEDLYALPPRVVGSRRSGPENAWGGVAVGGSEGQRLRGTMSVGGGFWPSEGGPLVTTVGGGQGWGHLRTVQSQAGHLGCAVAPASGEGTNCGNKLQQRSFVVKRKLQNLSGCF